MAELDTGGIAAEQPLTDLAAGSPRKPEETPEPETDEDE